MLREQNPVPQERASILVLRRHIHTVKGLCEVILVCGCVPIAGCGDCAPPQLLLQLPLRARLVWVELPLLCVQLSCLRRSETAIFLSLLKCAKSAYPYAVSVQSSHEQYDTPPGNVLARRCFSIKACACLTTL
jgi:hypothetical protein